MNADNNFASEEVANGSASESAKMATSEEGRSSRRRKIVLFMGYLGEKYQGMQRNPGTTTIEGALMEALVKAGCIDLELENDFAKLKWSRAARTDKGVSAAGQVVSAMLHGEVDGQLQDSVIDKINEHIDDDIKVYGWLRPTASFGAKNDCVRRRYEYIMPESALGKLEGTDGTDSAGDRDPRISRFNDILAKYKGSHKFHNFTDNMDGKDPTAQRYILDCTCSEPFLVDSDKFVKVTLLGQSFVLHQIRKMIGLALQIIWCGIPEEVIDVCLSPEKEMQVPTAPALGLLLVECYFDFYNKRYARDLRQPVSMERFQDTAEKFKRERIYPFIAKRERETASMEKWIRRLPQVFKIDSEEIMGDYKMLAEEKQRGEEKRRKRLESLCPVYDNIGATFGLPTGPELETKEQMVMHIKRAFDKAFGYSPVAFARVPGSLVLIGELQELHELPVLGFSTHDTVICAVAKKLNADTILVKHVDDCFAEAALRPNGCRLASLEDDNKTEWSKFVSWGWQCGVSAKGVRPRSLPAARLMFGGTLKQSDSCKGGEVATLVASLMSFMDIHAWKMPRAQIAQMCYSWDRQGRGVPIGLQRYMMTLCGVKDRLTKISFAPRVEATNSHLPNNFCIYRVTLQCPSLTYVPQEEEGRKALLNSLQSECQVAARVLSKRLKQENFLLHKSLGMLCVAMNASVADLNRTVVHVLNLNPEEELTVEQVAEELASGDVQKLRGICGDVNNFDKCRLGQLTYLALAEAKAVDDVEMALNMNESKADMLQYICERLRESQERLSFLVPESSEEIELHKLCLAHGALSFSRSIYPKVSKTWSGSCVVAADVCESFTSKMEADGSYKIERMHPSVGAAVWAFMRKPEAKKRKKAAR